VIEWLWQLLLELREFVLTNFDPVRDTLDIALVALAIYWVLVLIRGTRAVQILVGLLVLLAANLTSEIFQLVTLRAILETFIPYSVLIVIVLFQQDIRRALARVGRGFFAAVTARQESQMLEEVVRAAQALSRRRLGALIVLERETSLADLLEAGTPLDANVAKELLISLFHPSSPLHDGAVVIQQGRLASAGCILPLTARADLPEGLGTRHRAALGISEETDAVAVVVSEETAAISVVVGGEIARGLDAPRLRVLLRDILGGEQRELARAVEAASAEAEAARAAEAEPESAPALGASGAAGGARRARSAP
jgi:uncharacterized protein (TIGR00159 family)